MATGQVHRFRESVAAYVGKGQTVYMTPDEAETFAAALLKVAKSCREEGFAKSTAGTHHLTFTDRKNGDGQ